MTCRRTGAIVLSCTAVLGSGVALAAPAAARVPLRQPSQVNVVARTSTSLTVAQHRQSGASQYRLYVSTVKSDVYVANIRRSHRHLMVKSTTKPRITLRHLTYSAHPLYYRVAVTNGHHLRWNPTYKTAYLRPPRPTALTAVSGSRGTYLRWRSKRVNGSVIQQATDSTFTHGLHTYRIKGPARSFTPFGLTKGSRYYFRVRGRNAGMQSSPSNSASVAVRAKGSPVTVLSYNTLDAVYDGERHPGSVSAPFSRRRAGQLALIRQSKAAVVGIQEGNSCLRHRPGRTCYRQIDSLAHGLRARYKLDNTNHSSVGVNPYAGNYILYKPSEVAPVGAGGHWLIGPTHKIGFAQYQVFRDKHSGAKFLFVTTHLPSPTGAKYDVRRGVETRRMLAHSHKFATSRGITSVVYTGDYNSFPGEYHRVDTSGKAMQAAGLSDAIQVAQSRTNAQYDSINGLYRTPPKGRGSADHVFVSPGIAVKSWGELLHLRHGKFVGTIPSDHNPVMARLVIPG